MSEINESMTTRDSKGYGKSVASGILATHDKINSSGTGAENIQDPVYNTLTQKINNDVINRSK